LKPKKIFAYSDFVSPSPPQSNRFFVCPQYSIYYRRQKKLEWNNPARVDYEVIFLFDGNITLESGEASEVLKGQSLLLNPSNEFKISGKGIEYLRLSLDPLFVSDHAVRMQLLSTGALVVFAQNLVGADGRLQDWGHSLAAELNEGRPGGEIVIGALVEQILVHLLRHYASMRRSDQLEFSRAGLVDRRIRRSVELMHAQLAAELSLKEIAAASYLSPFHFARVFKKLTGTTPHAYLAGIRTARAQLLLANPELSVAGIGARVGYASPSHFTKAFRQATGLSPRAFRNGLVSR
jgi:AraC-like DNA-binding protein